MFCLPNKVRRQTRETWRVENIVFACALKKIISFSKKDIFFLCYNVLHKKLFTVNTSFQNIQRSRYTMCLNVYWAFLFYKLNFHPLSKGVKTLWNCERGSCTLNDHISVMLSTYIHCLLPHLPLYFACNFSNCQMSCSVCQLMQQGYSHLPYTGWQLPAATASCIPIPANSHNNLSSLSSYNKLSAPKLLLTAKSCYSAIWNISAECQPLPGASPGEGI